ncbi:polyphosphate kinase 1, partial [Dawidia soli]
FLSIYSSNLDEFYRVRVPALMALQTLATKSDGRDLPDVLPDVTKTIHAQQEQFGQTMITQILPALRRHDIRLLYHEPIPDVILPAVHDVFAHDASTFLHIIPLSERTDFFPENNTLYLVIAHADAAGTERISLVRVPTHHLPRFYSIHHDGTRYILFLEDIIRANLGKAFGEDHIHACHGFKVTRDAELDLEDEFEGNLAKKIERKITQRDLGFATRFLHEPGIPAHILAYLKKRLGLKKATFVQGGSHHNLKDLATLPLKDPSFSYPPWTTRAYLPNNPEGSLCEEIRDRDILLHPPYHTYHAVLRFFNEASIDPHVTRIYVTLYRVAHDSRIAHALINAARNGKKVTVFVELKARFDEANNLHWMKKMKAAGVQVIQSLPGLKVHAKMAMLKRKTVTGTEYLGLLATGNFNESTARFYTDHILFTAHQPMLLEIEKVFRFLKQKRRPGAIPPITFRYLLVGQFNLQQQFIRLIEREIAFAGKGIPAAITIKLNNLEDKVLIGKLYDASRAGVQVSLIVRSVCCLIPGVPGMSENITVRRIIDRYLEHGRVFIFHNAGDEEVYLGSADWMNRNIYRRVEVCFPLRDEALKTVVKNIVRLQLQDTAQAVLLDDHLRNIPVTPPPGVAPVRSQQQIAEMI